MSFGTDERSGWPGYEVLGVLARDPSWVMLSAYRVNHLLGRKWPVTLRVVWDAELAKEEAQNWTALQQNPVFGPLIEYFEVERESVLPWLNGFAFPEILDLSGGQAPMDIPMALTRGLAGVLVLPALQGRPIINRVRPYPGRPRWWSKDVFMVYDASSRKWLEQRLRWFLSLDEKIHILGQVAGAIRDCHKNGWVHGRLCPQMLMYNPRRLQVTLLDIGGRGEMGPPGWRAPEQIPGKGGRSQRQTTATDVFLLGLLLIQFLISEPGEDRLYPWGERCCRKDPVQRPELDDVFAVLKDYTPVR